MPQDKGRQGRRQRRIARRRQHILAAAARVFARKGFDQATVKEIADEADLAEGTLYNYFGSKRDILLAIAGDTEASAVAIRQAVEGMDDRAAMILMFEKALDISVVLFVLFNIPLSTLAIVIAQGQGVKWNEAIQNTLKIPIFYGVVLAFFCKIFGWDPPDFILKATDLLGQAAIPLMLVLLGMQLSRSKLSHDWAFFSIATTTRLIVGPLIAIVLVLILGLEGIQRKVVILQTSTPSAVLPLLYCMRFGTCPEHVSGLAFRSSGQRPAN